MNRPNKILFRIALFAIMLTTTAKAETLKSISEETSTLQVGKTVAERYLSAPFRSFDGAKNAPNEVIYPEVCAWFGALKFANATSDKELLRKLELRFLPLLGKNKELMQKPDHVDHTVFGTIPLQLYMQTGIEPYYHIGIDFADRQWQLPKGSKHEREYKALLESGLSWQSRFWIDDMFMISAIQTQAYLASKDPKYIERATHGMVVYLDSIQQPNGLFYHAPSVPFFWCRGNGWMAAGMTELLKNLPKDNKEYSIILAKYRKMMETLKSSQNEEGLWGQLIDHQDSWTETSGSAMITYAMIMGVKKGWLDAKTYEPIVRRAWPKLIEYINEDGDIEEVCMGTNIGNSKQYYLDRRRIIGDLHGQAAILWCATALIEE